MKTMFALTAIMASVLLVGGLGAAQAADIFRVNDGDGSLTPSADTLSNSVDISNANHDRWRGTGDFTVVTNDELTGLNNEIDRLENRVQQLKTKGGDDHNGAPSMQGARGIQSDIGLVVNGAECGTIMDLGSQLSLYNCKRDTPTSDVFIYYKGIRVDVDTVDKGEVSSHLRVVIPTALQYDTPLLLDTEQVDVNGYMYEKQTWLTPVGPQ